MKTRWSSRANWMVGVMGLVLVASFCSKTPATKSRAQELVTTLKKQNIPGLPDPLSAEQIKEIDAALAGPGAWFVEKGCFACHAVSVYGVKSYTNVGPDLAVAVTDVKSRFGKDIDEFWREPIGTMMIVRNDLIKLSPEEQALALEKLKTAYADYQKSKSNTQ